MGRGGGRRRAQRAGLCGLPGPRRVVGPGAGAARASGGRVHPRTPLPGRAVRRESLRLRRGPARSGGHRRAGPAPPRPRGVRGRSQPVGALRGRLVAGPVERRRPDAGRAGGARPLPRRHRGLLGVRADLRRHAQAAAHREPGQLDRRLAHPRRARGHARARPVDDRHPLRGVDLGRARPLRQRPAHQGRALRAGRDRCLRRPPRLGHGVREADALPGRPRGAGPGVGLRAGRHGHDQLRPRRSRGRGRRGARLRGRGGRDPSR